MITSQTRKNALRRLGECVEAWFADPRRRLKLAAAGSTILWVISGVLISLLGGTLVNWGWNSYRDKEWLDFWPYLTDDHSLKLAAGSGLLWLIARSFYHEKVLAMFDARLTTSSSTIYSAAESLAKIEQLRLLTDTCNLLARSNFMTHDDLVACKEEAQEASRAWAANLSAWHGKTKVSSDPLEKKLLLAHASTYLREEAFDVARGEMVTNGRNYTMLRISALATLLANLGSGETVVSFLYSTVPPGDWYNTPVARPGPPQTKKHKEYSDMGFPNLFHRSLRELLLSANCKGEKRFMHATLLVAAQERTLHRFHWKLESAEKVKKDLENIQLMPISVTLQALTELDDRSPNSVAKAIIEYYGALFANNPSEDARKSITFAPMINLSWKKQLLDAGSPKDDPLVEAATNLSEVKLTELPKFAPILTAKMRRVAKNNFLHCIALCRGIGNGREFEDVFSRLQKTAHESAPVANFDQLLGQLHEMSLAWALQETRASPKDPIHALLLAWFRLRELSRHDLEYRSLSETFAHDLHHDTSFAKLLTLKEAAQAPPWLSQEQLSGLMFFGILEPPAPGEGTLFSFTNVRWKAAIGARLHHGQDALTVRFLGPEERIAYAERISDDWRHSEEVAAP